MIHGNCVTTSNLVRQSRNQRRKYGFHRKGAERAESFWYTLLLSVLRASAVRSPEICASHANFSP